LKDSTTKALEDNKIKPAGQPKLDLKIYGEDKDLEYIISVTELPKVELKSVENIKFDEYSVKIDNTETDKRIKEIAKSQNNFKDIADDVKAVKENLVIFDFKATIDGKDFTGGEGKNTQLILGKDLFIKGFDDQLIGVKKNEVIFTSGATESNNLAIKGIADKYKGRGKHIITTNLEHGSISEIMNYLKKQEYEISYVDVDDKLNDLIIILCAIISGGLFILS